MYIVIHFTKRMKLFLQIVIFCLKRDNSYLLYYKMTTFLLNIYLYDSTILDFMNIIYGFRDK